MRYRKGKEGAMQTKEVPHWGLSKDMPRVTTGENQTSYLSNQDVTCRLGIEHRKTEWTWRDNKKDSRRDI